MLSAYWNRVEVWRCASESQDVDEPPYRVIQGAQPTTRQLTASAAAAGKYGTSPSRGNFLPWANFDTEAGQEGVTRFSFPFLGVTATDEVCIWDVRTGALVQTLLDIQEANSYEVGGGIVSADDDEEVQYLGDVKDSNLTERYVFVCGTECLRVFDRSVQVVVGMGRERAVSVEDMTPQAVFGKWCFTVAMDDCGEVIQKRHIEGALVIEHETVLMEATYEASAEFLTGECLDGYAIDISCRTRLS